MFQTNAFFRFYQCPKKRKTKKCSRPYCQYNHGEESEGIIDYSQTNFGFDDFFSNLKPEDIEGYAQTTSSSYADHSTTSIHIDSSSNSPPGLIKNPPKQESRRNESAIKIEDSKNNTESELKLETGQKNIDNDQEQQTPSKENKDTESIHKNTFTNDSTMAGNKRINQDDICMPGKKVRIAHTPNYDVTKKPTIINKRKNYRQVMMERYLKTCSMISKDKNLNKIENTIPSELSMSNLHPINTNPLNSFKIQCHSSETNISKTINNQIVPNSKQENIDSSIDSVTLKEVAKKSKTFTPCTVSKSEKRVAHIPTKNTQKLFDFNRMPLAVASSKIALKIRTNHLNKIYEELLKYNKSNKSREELCQEARVMEKEICVRSKNLSSVYMSLTTSKICSIRTADEQSSVQNKRLTIDKSISNNYSIVKKPKLTYKDLNSQQLASLLEKLIIPKEDLFKYGFPIHNETTGLAIFLQDTNNKMSLINYEENILITCDRCLKTYRNPQIPEESKCVFHSGHAYNFRVQGNVERVYSCCRNESDSVGCNTSEVHVTKGHQFIESRKGFIKTLPSNQTPKAYALDCEMCFTEMAFELCRVTLLDFEGNIVYDSLVKPTYRIIDYNTQYSGLKETDFANVETTLEEVQTEILKFIKAESFIIGHGLDSDFKVLKLYHDRVIDTTHLYPHKRGLPFKKALKTLAVNYLNKIIQDNVSGHDSLEDAKTALELVKLNLKDEVNKHNISFDV